MPEQVTFIGREDEIHNINQWIAQWGDCGIVCIHGEGGIGKSRLLQEIHKRYSLSQSRYISEEIEKRSVKIALVQQYTMGEWSQEFLTGARSMADELDVELIETDAESDPDKMITNLENMIQQEVDTIIIRLGSIDKLSSGIQQAIQKGIKILISGLTSKQFDEGVTRVLQNDEGGVSRLVNQLAKDLEYQGEIVLIGDEIRRDLFKKMLNILYPDIDVVVELAIEGDNLKISERIYDQIQETLESHPDIQAIMTTGDELAKEVAYALKEQKRSHIGIYSFDLCQSNIELMFQPDNCWKATIDTYPKEQGRIMIRLAIQAAYDQSIDSRYILPTKLVTRDLLQESNQELLSYETDIGWTSWLRSLLGQNEQEVTQTIPLREIIDFDDRHALNPEKMNRKIARMLDRRIFRPFFNAQRDYQKMQMAGVSVESLNRQKTEVDNTFITCINTISQKRRLLLFFDTIDDKEGQKSALQDLKSKITRFKNVVILLSGRKAKDFGASLESKNDSFVEFIDLQPLSIEDSRRYLQEIGQKRHVHIEPDLGEKLLILSGGRPILLDLAVEWRARGISLEWLAESSAKEIYLLKKEQLTKRQQEVEKNLVGHIKEMRHSRDQLILLLSYVYPLNYQMVREFFREEHSSALFKEIADYVFVKQLPSGYIKLHDEMERMVNVHVWPEVDQEKDRRRWYSEIAATCFTNEINVLTENLNTQQEQLKEIEKKGKQPGKALKVSLKIQDLEQDLWSLKEQLLHHTLVANLDQGVKLFEELFEQAAKSSSRFSSRQQFFDELQKYVKKLSPEQTYIHNICQAELYFDSAEYQRTKDLCEEILHRPDITTAQRAETLIWLGNTRIRLGKVRESINDFEKAVKLTRANEFIGKIGNRWKQISRGKLKEAFKIPKEVRDRIFSEIFRHPLEVLSLLASVKTKTQHKDDSKLGIWRVKALNGLGWAYRLFGDLKRAEKYYREARRKCILEGGLAEEELKAVYGWISNNLSFVLSEHKESRETAIDIAQEALNHWKAIGDEIGLGAAYLVLGNAYYRDGRLRSAAAAYQEALKIFEPLNHQDWLGRIYSWQGVLNLAMHHPKDPSTHNLLNDAENGLKKSQAIGTSYIQAMTLNRLGRVYMRRIKWEQAQECMQKSFELAQKIPDYRYWLLSLARLPSIAAELEQYDRLAEYHQLLEKAPELTKKSYKYDLGVGYIGLAKLALKQNNPDNVQIIIKFLKQGISLMAESASYAHGNVIGRLGLEENDFDRIQPEIIRAVGQSLQAYIIKKENKNTDYTVVTPIMFKWANWKKGGKD